MNTYQRAKEKARNKVIEWQKSFDGKCLSWDEISYYNYYFCKLAKRYGLTEEFRKNGII